MSLPLQMAHEKKAPGNKQEPKLTLPVYSMSAGSASSGVVRSTK